MDLQLKLAFTGNLRDFAQQTHLRIARGARNAVEKQAARAKLVLRQDTRRALGDKVANAWRADIYPPSASVRTHMPAVQVYTNAPLIVEAFSADTVIIAKRGAYLAIPTQNVPRRGGRGGRGQASRWTVKEVEEFYQQKLILIRTGSGFIGFIDKTLNRRKARWERLKNKNRAAPEQRKDVRLWPMFIFVRQVGLKKRLDTVKNFADLAKGWAELFPAEIAAALNAGSN